MLIGCREALRQGQEVEIEVAAGDYRAFMRDYRDFAYQTLPLLERRFSAAEPL
jgi:hypothetical protein